MFEAKLGGHIDSTVTEGKLSCAYYMMNEKHLLVLRMDVLVRVFEGALCKNMVISDYYI